MKTEQLNIEIVRNLWFEMQSKQDLVNLLNTAKEILYGDVFAPIQLKQLTYYANPNLCKKRYTSFTVKKKSGDDRTIHAPVNGLKSILRALNFVLQCIYEPNKAATGFVVGKSIVDNAKPHVGHNYVYNMDLKDFFHSFDRNRVKWGLINKPFDLKDEKTDLAFIIACLVTHPFEIDGKTKIVLPQGSPTSPTLSNILCKGLDRKLTGLANRFGLTYTRYADDITFSSQHNVYGRDDFKQELRRIIESQQFIINPKKTRLQKKGFRQEATGLMVTEKANVNRQYIKQIRMWLYYWEKYGYDKAQGIFSKRYILEARNGKKKIPQLKNVLDGKLEYLKMVKGLEDSTYLRLKAKFTTFQEDLKETNPQKIDLNIILMSLEKKGVEHALTLFKEYKKQAQ